MKSSIPHPLGNLAAPKCIAVRLIAKVHQKKNPLLVNQKRHRARALDRVRKLPKNVMPIFVGETLFVRLHYCSRCQPEESILNFGQHLKALTLIGTEEVLEPIDTPDAGKEPPQPIHSTLRLRLCDFMHKLLKLPGPKGITLDRISLDHCNLQAVSVA